MLDMNIIKVMRRALNADAESSLALAGEYAAQGDHDMAERYRGISAAYLWASGNMLTVKDTRNIQRGCRKFADKWGGKRMGAWRRGYVETLGAVADTLAGLV